MTVSDAGIADTVRRKGIATAPGLVSGSLLAKLRNRCRELADGEHAINFPKSTRVWDLYRHGGTFLDLLTLPALTALLTDLLGEHHLLSDYSLNVVNPGQPMDNWHIDYPYNEMPNLVEGAQLGVQCILAIDEFTAHNGATHYLPGTHTPPSRPCRDVSDPHQVLEATPGTLIILAASTWHRSGYNASGTARTGILLSFVERWIRPMTDPPEHGPWSRTQQIRFLLGQERPPETINGVPIAGARNDA